MKIGFRNLRLLVALCLPAAGGFAQTIASFAPASPFLSALPTTSTLSGQMFTAEISATAGMVTVLAQSIGAGPTSVTFQLRSVSGGLPTSAILAAVTRPGTTLTGTLAPFSVDFSSQGIFLTSGQSYALTLLGSSMFGLGGAADGYAGGAQVIGGTTSLALFAPSRDLAFSVAAAPAIAAVPEPSTYSAMGVVALIGICAWSRLRRRKV